eukprot:3416500-Alexandrium_andersonii.AAC.1
MHRGATVRCWWFVVGGLFPPDCPCGSAPNPRGRPHSFPGLAHTLQGPRVVRNPAIRSSALSDGGVQGQYRLLAALSGCMQFYA